MYGEAKRKGVSMDKDYTNTVIVSAPCLRRGCRHSQCRSFRRFLYLGTTLETLGTKVNNIQLVVP